MSRTFQDHEIRQYLLGDLSPAEEEQIETTWFRQPELLARVELARDDLADDYAAGRLSKADREKFERRLLATDEGREQLAITKALRQSASRHGGDPEDPPDE
jgi:anti-sigma factor RsiW